MFRVPGFVWAPRREDHGAAGALFALASDPRRLVKAASNILALARANWSMPPDHGAAVVRVILEDVRLTELWASELETMRQRLANLRFELTTHGQGFTSAGAQNGLFACLPLTAHQVARFRDEYAIYLAASGRINLAGLTSETIPDFVHAYRTVQQDSLR